MEYWSVIASITTPDIVLFCTFVVGALFGIILCAFYDLVCEAREWFRSRNKHQPTPEKEAP